MALYQIKAKHFCAGIVFEIPWAPDKVSNAAPILRYMVGYTLAEVKAYCKKKGWQLSKVQPKRYAELMRVSHAVKRTKKEAAYLREVNAAATDVLNALKAMRKDNPDSFAVLSRGMRDDGYVIEETMAFMEKLRKLK